MLICKKLTFEILRNFEFIYFYKVKRVDIRTQQVLNFGYLA